MPPADLANRLLDASDHILGGDPPPRLEDVARHVGASRATMYYYFAGRDDLLAFLLVEHARQGAEAVRAALRADDPPAAQLRTMVSVLTGYLGRRPAICSGLLGAFGGAGRMREALQANDVMIAGPMRVLLARGRADGEFAVADVATAANAIMGAMLLAVLGRASDGGDTTDDAFRDQVTEHVVGGVLAR
jgi:AcrR family transcriptional regulator